jgi:hypothetical protein
LAGTSSPNSLRTLKSISFGDRWHQ